MMNEKDRIKMAVKIDYRRFLIPLIAFISCGLLTGCCTSTVKEISEIHEVMTPQQIISNGNGMIAIKVNSTFYGREQYENSTSKPLAQYPPRVRYLLLDPNWVRSQISKKVAAGSIVPIKSIFLDFQSTGMRVMPASFLAPEVAWYSMYARQDAASAKSYPLNGLVPYQAQNGAVYLNFEKVKITSRRTQAQWWAYLATGPAMAIDGVLAVAAVVVAFPIAVVVVPVGFVFIGVCWTYEEHRQGKKIAELTIENSNGVRDDLSIINEGMHHKTRACPGSLARELQFLFLA
jgi:hypothetical protein